MTSKYSEITIDELLKDLRDSIEDIINCKKAIALGMTDHKGLHWRADKNEEFITTIQNEIKERIANGV
jgi:hypothetical protein